MRGLKSSRRAFGAAMIAVVAAVGVTAWWLLGEADGRAEAPTSLEVRRDIRSRGAPLVPEDDDGRMRVESPTVPRTGAADGVRSTGRHVRIHASLRAEACDGFTYSLVLDHSARRRVHDEVISCTSPTFIGGLRPGRYTCTLVGEQGAVARRSVSLPTPGMTAEVVFDAAEHCGLVVEVTDSLGNPVVGARVLLRRITDRHGNVSALTGKSGCANLAFLRPDGAYAVHVDAEGFAGRDVGPILFERPEPRRVVVVLAPSIDLDFRVECEDAYARESAVVAVTARHYSESFDVDTDGRGTAADVPPGRVTLAAAAPDHATTFAQADLRLGVPPPEIVLQLVPGRYVTGRFVHRDGNPYTADSMIVTPLHEDVPLGHSVAAEADRDGRFEAGPFACDVVELTNSDFVDFREVLRVGVETQVIVPERHNEAVSVVVATAGGAPRPPHVDVSVLCRGVRGGAHVERSVGLGRHSPDADGRVTLSWPRACATPEVLVEAQGFAPARAACRPEPTSDGDLLTAHVILQRRVDRELVVLGAHGNVGADASAILLGDSATPDAFDPRVSRIALDEGVSSATALEADEHGRIAVPVDEDDDSPGYLIVSAPGHLPVQLDVTALGRSQAVRLTAVR